MSNAPCRGRAQNCSFKITQKEALHQTSQQLTKGG